MGFPQRSFVDALKACARNLVIAGVCIGLVSCGDDPGVPDFSSQADLIPPDQKFEEPDPFRRGKARLSVDIFYEGGRSETIKINGFRTHYFVFGQQEVGRPTYDQARSLDRLEGERSTQITLVGTPFWGGGVIWDQPIDLSDWTTLFVSFKSSDPSFASFDLSLLYEQDGMEQSVNLDPTDYGYANDGLWHSLEIPFRDAIRSGFDPSSVRSPFVIGGPGGEAGDRLLIDNLYFTKD